MGTAVRLDPTPAERVAAGDDERPAPADGSDATRYLCAAAHLDPAFRQVVLQDTVLDPHRAVYPSFGVDLSVVARHAMVAERQAFGRDAGLTAVWLAAAVLAIGWVASVDLLGFARYPSSEPLTRNLAQVLAAFAALLLVAWVVVAWAWARTVRTLSGYLLAGGAPDALAAPDDPQARRALAELAEANSGNVIVFSGLDPFAGAGHLVDASSFSVPLRRTARGGRPAESTSDPFGPGAGPARSGSAEFSLVELIARVESELDGLRPWNVRTQRRLFVNGRDVARFGLLLPNPNRRPVVRLPDRVVDQAVERAGRTVRPYLCVEATGWRGQLVVTSSIRVVRLSGVLFVELSTHVLPPLRDDLREVDRMRIRTAADRRLTVAVTATRSFLGALAAAPHQVAAATRTRRAAGRQARDRDREWLPGADLPADRGAETSLRKQACADAPPEYFLQRDMDMYVEVVRQRLVGAIADFLAARGYDTDWRDRVQGDLLTVELAEDDGDDGAPGAG